MKVLTEEEFNAQKYVDVVIDWESLSLKSNAVLTTVGLVFCDITTGEVFEKVSMCLDVQEQIDSGRYHVDADTIGWWLRQSDAARLTQSDTLKGENVISRATAFQNIARFIENICKELGREPVIYGNGISFDLSVMHYEYTDVLGVPVPWPHWAECDIKGVRTLLRRTLGIDIAKNVPGGNKTPHDALSDADYQARYLTDAAQELSRHRNILK